MSDHVLVGSTKPMRITMDAVGKKLLSVNEFRTLYAGGIGRTKFYELVRSGKVSLVKIGRRSFVPVSSAEEFLKSLGKKLCGVES